MEYLRLILDPQWFIVVGLIITLLGVIYTSGNYLDKKFSSLKLITQALAFVVSSAIIIFVNDILFTLILKENLNNTALLLGFTIGFAVFIMYNLAKRFRQNTLLFIIIICVSFLVNALSKNISSLNPYAIFLIYSFAYISSFILGLLTASLTISLWKKTVFGFLIICLIIALLIVLNLFLKVAIAGIITNEFIYTIGFVVGNTLYDPHPGYIHAQAQIWKSFIVWLLIGCLAPLIILLPNFLFNTEAALLTYIFCINNAQGRVIIQQIRPRYKYINPDIGQPLINWKRLRYSLLIAILITIPLLMIYILYLSSGDIHNFEIDFIFLGLAFFSKIFIIIPLIYGFGNAIIYKLENLSERRLGQIGLILTIGGIFITTFLPH